ncbi:MAG: hypothetical protein H6573_25995 [Lewinellaceae bacterium]|nr:hypothetical protein [Lewinellaceae bacterium]
MNTIKHYLFTGLLLCFWSLVFTQNPNPQCLQELLKPLNSIPLQYQAPVNNPDAAANAVLMSLKHPGSPLPWGFEVVNTVITKAPEGSNHFKLTEIKSQAISQLKQLQLDGGGDTLFSNLENEMNAIIGLDSPEYPNAQSFPQQRVQLAASLARYLLRHFHAHPEKLKGDTLWSEAITCGAAPTTAMPGDTVGSPPEPDKLDQALTGITEVNEGLSQIFLLSLGLGLLFLLFNGILLFLLIRMRRSLKKVSERVYAVKQQLFTQAGGEVQEKEAGRAGQENSGLLKEKEDRIKELEKEVAKYEKAAGEEVEDNPPPIRKTPIEVKQGTQEKDYIATFYSTPPKDWLFFERRLSDTLAPKKHIYRINVINADEAEYDLVDDQYSRSMALNMPDRFILPAMTTRGEGDLKRARMVETKPGRLIKQGKNWRIKEKAILSYS